jgi:hypothetical protein
MQTTRLISKSSKVVENEMPKKKTAAAARPETDRATYHLPPELIDKVRDVAWWDRETINAVVSAAIGEHIARREKKRGQPYPKREGELRRGKSLA